MITDDWKFVMASSRRNFFYPPSVNVFVSPKEILAYPTREADSQLNFIELYFATLERAKLEKFKEIEAMSSEAKNNYIKAIWYDAHFPKKKFYEGSVDYGFNVNSQLESEWQDKWDKLTPEQQINFEIMIGEKPIRRLKQNRT